MLQPPAAHRCDIGNLALAVGVVISLFVFKPRIASHSQTVTEPILAEHKNEAGAHRERLRERK